MKFKLTFEFETVLVRCRSSKLKTPRRVMLMVKAGAPVDAMITNIVPHLEAGDIIIDGGNSEYTDTNVSNKWTEKYI